MEKSHSSLLCPEGRWVTLDHSKWDTVATYFWTGERKPSACSHFRGELTRWKTLSQRSFALPGDKWQVGLPHWTVLSRESAPWALLTEGGEEPELHPVLLWEGVRVQP